MLLDYGHVRAMPAIGILEANTELVLLEEGAQPLQLDGDVLEGIK